MRTLILGYFVTLTLFLSACASDIYLKTLKMDIMNAPYSSEGYILGQFDCSNEAALLDDWLEGKGYDSKIMVHPTGPRGDVPLQYHALLFVDNKYLVDPVTKKILKGKTPQDYPGAVIFLDAEMLQEYLEPEEWEKEWGYEESGKLVYDPLGPTHRANLQAGITKAIIASIVILGGAYIFASVITGD